LLASARHPKRKTDGVGGDHSPVSLAEYLAWAVGSGGCFERPRTGMSARKSGRHTTCFGMPTLVTIISSVDDVSGKVGQPEVLRLPQHTLDHLTTTTGQHENIHVSDCIL
jgi:hypothetical protein